MSDQPEYEFVDEAGNPLDPSELGDYEIVDEEVGEAVVETSAAPTAPESPASATAPAEAAGPAVKQPAPAPAQNNSARRGVRGWQVGAAVVAIAVVTGAGFVMVRQGPASERPSMSDRVASKSVAVSSAVESKVEEVEQSRVGRKIAGSACHDEQIAGAAWDGTGEKPRYQLRKVGSTELPGGIRAGMSSKRKGEPRELSMLSLGGDRLGVYVSGPTAEVSSGRGTWQKALISVAAQAHPAVLGEGTTVCGDRDTMGACETKQVGQYLVLDAGADDQPATIEVMKQLRQQSPNLYAVVGDELIVMELEEAEDAVEGGGAPASPSPSK